MSAEILRRFNQNRNGTNQARRMPEALKDGFVRVDEQSPEDLLRFAQALGPELIFYSLENAPAGDWREFLGQNPALMQEAAAYLEDPDSFELDDERLPWLSRPHLALFLAYLKLLKDYPGKLLNQYVERHRDHYFRDILRFDPKPPQPDQVHLYFRLADTFAGKMWNLPAGTRLDGGQDAEGNPLIYTTTQDLILNRAAVAAVKSVFVNRQVESISSLPFPGGLIRMLELALGEKDGSLLPGGSLPIWPGMGGPGLLGLQPVDVNFLRSQLLPFLRFVPNELSMSYAIFRKLMRLKEQRDRDLDQWAELNSYMPGTATPFAEPRDFPGNFEARTGLYPLDEDVYATLENVNNIYDLYDELEYLLEAPPDNAALQTALVNFRGFIHFSFYGGTGSEADSVSAFRNMMRIREAINRDWREIAELLESATQEEGGLTLNQEQTDYEAKFDGLFLDAYSLTPPDFSSASPGISSLNQYYEVLLRVEHYFGLYAEEILAILDAAYESRSGLSRQETDALLERAHQNKARIKRQDVLRGIRENQGFTDMLQEALGMPRPGDALPDPPHGLADADFRFIMQVQEDETAPAPGDDGAPPWQWARVYQLLEAAERRLRRIPDLPPPALVTFQGVHAADDATALQAGRPGEEFPSWHPFGTAEAPPARLGLCISSPLLALAGGERVITLDILLTEGSLTDEFSSVVGALRLQVSGEKDWLDAPAPEANLLSDIHTLRIELTLPEGFDPVAPLPTEHPDALEGVPMLRLQLGNPAHYAVFSRLRIEQVQLSVDVSGLAPTHIRNDDAVLPPGGAFLPFGSRPKPRSRFYFNHPELAAKRVDSIGLKIDWLGLPTDAEFKAMYFRYQGNSRNSKSSFTAGLKIYDRGVLRPTTAPNVPIFTNPVPGDLPPHDPLPAPTLTENILHSDRYYVLELGDTDFGHSLYPRRAAELAKELAVDLSPSNTLKNVTHYQISPPYTPEAQSVTINYRATTSNLLAPGTGNRGRAWHLHPFGNRRIRGEGVPFLGAYRDEGELYIGLEGAAPPTTVSLLFQVAEGSADPDRETPAINWSYLSGDDWQPAEVLNDYTKGLLNSGVLRIRLPGPADVAAQRLLPPGLVWLRAAVRENSAALSQIIGIHAQAVRAVLSNATAAAVHYETPLPPGSIAGLLPPLPAIAEVVQPYSSFGGRAAEAPGALNRRISERLRHKGRAVSPWDYERLILERFPQVHRVKCIPGGYPLAAAPGRLDVIVVPDIRELRPYDPFRPKTPVNTLAAIAAFLREIAPPAADIRVRNPEYLALQLSMTVILYPEYEQDAAFLLGELNAQLIRLLAPWAFDTGADIEIGGRIWPGLIVDFVEQQYYVDYIQRFDIRYEDEAGRLRVARPAELQQGLPIPRPDAIWVSARKHLLRDQFIQSGRGVGFGIVGVTLIVG